MTNDEKFGYPATMLPIAPEEADRINKQVSAIMSEIATPSLKYMVMSDMYGVVVYLTTEMHRTGGFVIRWVDEKSAYDLAWMVRYRLSEALHKIACDRYMRKNTANDR